MTRDAGNTFGVYHRILRRDKGAKSALGSTSISLSVKTMNTKSRLGENQSGRSSGIVGVTGSNKPAEVNCA